MTAPTYVNVFEGLYGGTETWNSASGPKITGTITTQAGDVLVCVGGAADQTTLGTPVTSGLTWNLEKSLTANATVYLWTTTDATGGSRTVQITATGSDHWGFHVLQYRASVGVGNSQSGSGASGYPNLSLTTAAANSAIVAVNVDWAAVLTSATWDSLASAVSVYELITDTGKYSVHVARWADAGSAAAKTISQSAPSGQTWQLLAVEVKGTVSAAWNYHVIQG